MSDQVLEAILRHYRILMTDLESLQTPKETDEDEEDDSVPPLMPKSPDALTQAMVNALKLAKVRPTTFGSNA